MYPVYPEPAVYVLNPRYPSYGTALCPMSLACIEIKNPAVYFHVNC